MNPPGWYLGSSIYCRHCHYNLRGLDQNRCPECGNAFDPSDAQTFSRSPSPDRIKQLIRRVRTRIADSSTVLLPDDATASRLTKLSRRVAALSMENDQLWEHATWLMGLLMEKGIITEQDVQNQVEREEFGTLPEIAAQEAGFKIDEKDESFSTEDLLDSDT